MLPEIPAYVELYENGEFKNKVEYFKEKLSSCDLCPRNCNINRHTDTGICLQGDKPRLTNAVVHTGEEPPLIEKSGAGAVFLSGCPMKCVYCQNFAFSQLNNGREVSVDELSEIFLELQDKGVSNLDLVTPTPHIPFWLEAVYNAIPKGFRLPIVYNTSSYERVEILRSLEGIIDVYLADIRYTENVNGKKYSKVDNYWDYARKAIIEMHRQVGSSRLIIRHLVMPNGVSGTEKALEFIAEDLSTRVNVSLMSQYFPVFNAKKFPEINSRLNESEYEKAVSMLEYYGLYEGWTQEFR